jgi:mannose-6-phosphate isomerase-like protein (cupin superfamily)
MSPQIQTATEAPTKAPTKAPHISPLVQNSPDPQVYRVKTQLLSKGRTKELLAKTPDGMTVWIKCYAQGGENALHAHPGEDHTFVILMGKARFFGKDGEISELGRNEGIMIPRGAFYRFESCGDEPLVLLRIGTENEKLPVPRIDPQGEPLPGKSKANKYEEGIPIEELFYE